ncbi:hypothetical protein DRJ22_04140 [Candidatus Woesearchaeota archaeon]|nr:MAG: hypothetical protein DRJ22_04140 [Candidatus Woesearchaeota archaeon]
MYSGIFPYKPSYLCFSLFLPFFSVLTFFAFFAVLFVIFYRLFSLFFIYSLVLNIILQWIFLEIYFKKSVFHYFVYFIRILLNLLQSLFYKNYFVTYKNLMSEK